MNKVFMSLVVGTSVLGLAGYGAYRILKDATNARSTVAGSIPPEQPGREHPSTRRFSHQVASQLIQIWEALKEHSGEVFDVDLVSTGEDMGAAAGPGATPDPWPSENSEPPNWEELQKRGAGCGIMGLTEEELDQILDEIKDNDDAREAEAAKRDEIDANNADIDQRAESLQARIVLINEDIDRLIAILASSMARLKETAAVQGQPRTMKDQKSQSCSDSRVRSIQCLFPHTPANINNYDEYIKALALGVDGGLFDTEDVADVTTEDINQVVDEICKVFHLAPEELLEIFLRLQYDTEDFVKESKRLQWHALFCTSEDFMRAQFEDLPGFEDLQEYTEIRGNFYDAMRDLFIELLEPYEEDLEECLLEAIHDISSDHELVF